MRVEITGTGGQVDTSVWTLDQALGTDIVQVGLPEIHLAQPEALCGAICAARPAAIISSAAYTAVDRAEDEPELAQSINGDAPGDLGRIAESLGGAILHMSTDYVFAEGKNGVYYEDDATDPQSVYGTAKRSGEEQIKCATDNYSILRTVWGQFALRQ